MRFTVTRRVTLRTVPGLLVGTLTLALAGSGVPASASAGAPHDEGCLPAVVDGLSTLRGRLDRLAFDGRAGQGQYWYVDRRRCKVVVAVLRGAVDATTRVFLDTALPVLIEVTEIDAPVVPRVGRGPASALSSRVPLHGGSAIYSGTSGSVVVCTSGFNNYRRDASTTAGHCAADSATWYDGDNTSIGTVGVSRFPGADWAVIPRSADVSLPDDVANGAGFTPITGFDRPRLDERVCGTGATSGTRCGTITATDVTVNYPTGAVTGLARSSQSGAGGDSGGPVFDGGTGVALISGGPDTGAPTFVQPLTF